MQYKTPKDHKEAIVKWFSKAFNTKYDIGQSEHEGRLWNKNTQPMLEEEAIDFISYIFTRREQVNEAIKLLEKILFVIPNPTRDETLEVYYLLQYGNIEGKLERDK